MPAHLVDGTAYIFRSFYSMRPMTAPDGTPINAVFGLGMTLQKLLNQRRPSRIAVAFDAGLRTFRNDRYEAYKANRGAPPEELVPQFDLCQQLTAAMGLATVSLPGWEADDVIATLTARLRAEDEEVLVVSGDKDLAQLLAEGVRLYDLARDEEWGAAEVPERMGVRAEQVPHLLALMGDSSDNIPGVPGVGRVAATALLERFADLPSIYAALDEVAEIPVRGARGLARKLQEGRELAFLSLELATVRRDAPCPLQPAELRWEGAHADRLDSFARRWGLERVASRVPRR